MNLHVLFLSPSADFGQTRLSRNGSTHYRPTQLQQNHVSIPLKYKSFIDGEIKLLEDVGCILKSLSD